MPFSTLIRLVNAYFQRDWHGEIFQGFNDVSPYVNRGLRMIYMLLSFAFTSSAFGAFFWRTGIIGGSFATIEYVACIVLLYFIAPRLKEIRVLVLIAGSFFGGASLAPWLTWFFGIDSGCIISGLVGISLGFRCFWAASMWARRCDVCFRNGLYISVLVIVLWTVTAGLEFGGHSLWTSRICSVILLFMMYVTAYSQVLAHRIANGDGDYVRHAITLFTDSPAFCLHFSRMIIGAILWAIEERTGE